VSQQLPKMPYEGGRVLRHHPGDTQSAAAAVTPFSPALGYEQHYGLNEKPFSLSADPRFLYRSPKHASAFDELLHGIRRREGLVVLTGEIGTGKTTLIRSVLQNLDRRTFSAFVPDPFVSREDLLKMLLVDFGVVSIGDLKRGSLKGASRPDLSYPLYEFLDSLVPLQAFAVLIVDEAQNLPLPLLEEIRILSDLEGREKLLQVVLVGQPELRVSLKLPQMRQVDQRVSVRCELAPLSRRDVGIYIRHRLTIASDGACRVEFTDDAVHAVHQGSAGTPRVINLICDRALHRGYAARAERIDASFITQAISDLGLEPPVEDNEEKAPEETPPAIARQAVHAERPDESFHSAWTEPAEQDTAVAPPVTFNVPPAQLLRAELLTESGLPASLELWDTPPSSAMSSRQREAVRAMPPEEILPADDDVPARPLSDFAAETDGAAAARLSPEAAWWVNVSGACLALIGVVIGGLYWYAGALDVPLAGLPAAPARRVLPTLPVPGAPDGIPAPAVPPKKASAPERVSIAVASFDTADRADRLVTDLARLGYAARTVTVVFEPPRPPIVKVLVGRYGSSLDAEDDLTTIRELFADARLERSTR
jgi:type II secretory pathway predicted ATPase ExeA